MVGTMNLSDFFYRNYKIVSDNRLPIAVKHEKICYPPPNPEYIDRVDTSYPGILIDFGNDQYLLEDGVHRIGKLQRQGIFESLFYIVSIEEFKQGLVHLVIQNMFTDKKEVHVLTDNGCLDPRPHK